MVLISLEMLLFLVLFLISSMAHSEELGVTYDSRSLIINGTKRILISGSIHYPRSTPDMWPALIHKAREGGLDVIDTYVFWNGHEPQPGKYYFEERYDLVKFIKLVQQNGLYVNLRIGPYVCAEWNFGGFPVWLKFVPGIRFRINNEPFKAAMKKFTKKIVKMMKDESLFESQGGPIILSQIENEYGPLENKLGDAGKLYAKWAGEMALNLTTGVTWIMCKQDDAPFPIINTCNGFYCDLFTPNDPRKPKMWTEVWTGWFTSFGNGVPYRPVQDLAFSVALFIAKGGSIFNYYMYHGGTNFGRTAGGPFIATSYDYDAPLDEYGLIRQPKWGHLKNLHAAIKQCEPALLSGYPIITNLGIKGGDNQQAYVYDSGKEKCCAFLKNYDQRNDVNVTFWNKQFKLPRWSVSILPDCENVVYNTAEVASTEYYSEADKPRMKTVEGGFKWESYSEAVGSTNDSCSFTAKGLLDQLNTTWDTSDYLWYMIRVNVGSGKGHYNLGNSSILRVSSAGDALYAFVNGKLSGTAHGSIDHAKFDYSADVSLRDGVNEISLLSVAVGLQNMGKFFETRPLGINRVSLGGNNLRMLNWTYKVGMKGEYLGIYSENGSYSVPWVKGEQLAFKQPLTWYKTWFDEPSGDDPLALDMDSMSKGQVWVNGNSLGRYWTSYKASGKCTSCSDYAGLFKEDKCLSRCGKASQHMYQVPRYWLKSTGNLLVVFEEWGGDPHGIKLVKRIVGSV